MSTTRTVVGDTISRAYHVYCTISLNKDTIVREIRTCLTNFQASRGQQCSVFMAVAGKSVAKRTAILLKSQPLWHSMALPHSALIINLYLTEVNFLQTLLTSNIAVLFLANESSKYHLDLTPMGCFGASAGSASCTDGS